jgi:hypothetical protein
MGLTLRDPVTGRFPKSVYGSKGPGWGGPKSDIPAGAGPGRIKGVKLSETAAARARAILESGAERAARTMVAIAENVEDQRALSASVAVLDRIGVHAKAGLEVGGEGGKPIPVEWHIVDGGDRDD